MLLREILDETKDPCDVLIMQRFRTDLATRLLPAGSQAVFPIPLLYGAHLVLANALRRIKEKRNISLAGSNLPLSHDQDSNLLHPYD